MKHSGLYFEAEKSINSEPSGSTLGDVSRYARNGTGTDVTMAQETSGLWVLDMNGSSSIVKMDYESQINVSGNYSVSMWIQPDDISTDQQLFQNGIDTNDRNGMGIYDGAVGIHYYDGSYTRKTGVPVQDVWQHIVGVCSGGTLAFYINGVAQTGTDSVGTSRYSSDEYMTFGGARDGVVDKQFYDGAFALAKVYDYPVDAGKVVQIFNQERRLFGV